MTTTIEGRKMSVRGEGLREVRLPWNGRECGVYCATYGVYRDGALVGWLYEPKEMLPAGSTLGIGGAVLATQAGLENLPMSGETRSDPKRMAQHVAFKAYYRIKKHQEECKTPKLF